MYILGWNQVVTTYTDVSDELKQYLLTGQWDWFIHFPTMHYLTKECTWKPIVSVGEIKNKHWYLGIGEHTVYASCEEITGVKELYDMTPWYDEFDELREVIA